MFWAVLVLFGGPVGGLVGSLGAGLLSNKGASDRNEQQMAMTREQMAGKKGCRILPISVKLLI